VLLSAASNVQIVDMTRSQNFRDYTKIDVGFSANRICKDLLSTKKISGKQHLEFRMECTAFLQTLVQKLLSRSPLNYKTARYMAAFDPQLMASTNKSDSNRTNLQRLLQELIDKQRFREQDADGVLQEYMKFIDEVVAQDRSRYLSFSPGSGSSEAGD